VRGGVGGAGGRVGTAGGGGSPVGDPERIRGGGAAARAGTRRGERAGAPAARGPRAVSGAGTPAARPEGDRRAWRLDSGGRAVCLARHQERQGAGGAGGPDAGAV